ncbi:Protein asteroid -like protein 1 [Halotydeus destructor]|nr:Protein asteroid -like protein 1 [Halotydeus destructor]
MGVQGFTTLIVKDIELFTDPFELKDTTLVIDGISLIRFLYNSSSQEFLNLQFSGNYVSFGRIVTAFFGNLKTNKVTSYVILHGAGKLYQQNEADRQSRDVIREDRLKRLVLCSREFLEKKNGLLIEKDIDLFPVLTIEVFRNVLKTLKIPCISPLVNYDTTIALVANELNCRVLSADSNFYMFNLKCGFVSLDTIKCNSDEIRNDEVFCGRSYNRASFLAKVGVKPEVLPLFAVIVGNTYRRRLGDGSDKIYEKMKALMNRQGKSASNSRLVQLLTWLKDKTLIDATDRFCKFMKDKDLEFALRNALDLTIQDYNLQNGLDCALTHLRGETCENRHFQMMNKDGRPCIMKGEMAARFIDENWIKEVAEMKLMRQIWTPLELDDYGQRPAIFMTIQMIQQLLMLIREPSQDDGSTVIVRDWLLDGKVFKLCDYQFNFSNDIVGLNYDLLVKFTADQRNSYALAILQVNTSVYLQLAKQVSVICHVSTDHSYELTLVFLILNYLRKLRPEQDGANIKYFMLAVVRSIVRYMRKVVGVPGVCDVRKTMSLKQRLNSLYLLNVVQKLVRIFGQISSTLNCNLPTIKPEEYFNGVLVTNLHADFTEYQRLSKMDVKVWQLFELLIQ